jgi:hypothetical protein
MVCLYRTGPYTLHIKGGRDWNAGVSSATPEASDGVERLWLDKAKSNIGRSGDVAGETPAFQSVGAANSVEAHEVYCAFKPTHSDRSSERRP